MKCQGKKINEIEEKLFEAVLLKKKINPKNATGNAFIHTTLSPGTGEKTKWVGKKREESHHIFKL